MTSPNKKQRISDTSSTTTTSRNLLKDIYGKVIGRKDYLSTICYFLTTRDIFKLLPSLSLFHYHYVNDNNTLKIIQHCLYYDYGDILNVFKIHWCCNDDDNNICVQIGRLYDLECLNLYAIQANLNAIIGHRWINISPLLKLENNVCVQYWIAKVKL